VLGVFIHLAVIPVSNVSVNPARSTATAIFGGGNALLQVWLFLMVPTVAGAVAGWLVKSRSLEI
jgi:aquaporin Z